MQIVRCSHTGCAACRGPRLVILRCSSTSIFKSAPPPPLSFSLPATTRPLFTTFPRGNSPLQKRLAHASLSLSLSLFSRSRSRSLPSSHTRGTRSRIDPLSIHHHCTSRLDPRPEIYPISFQSRSRATGRSSPEPESWQVPAHR